MIATDHWKPGCWSGAILKLCDQHLVEVNAEEDYRYPEQWMYLLWRPVQRFVPFMRPDGWGLTVGHPRDTVIQCLPADAELYLLAEVECVWSSWLQIPLMCERYEPWLVRQIEARRTEQRQLEGSRYAQWYSNSETGFQRFLSQLTGDT
jgi:hypothetical protein